MHHDHEHFLLSFLLLLLAEACLVPACGGALWAAVARHLQSYPTVRTCSLCRWDDVVKDSASELWLFVAQNFIFPAA